MSSACLRPARRGFAQSGVRRDSLRVLACSIYVDDSKLLTLNLGLFSFIKDQRALNTYLLAFLRQLETSFKKNYN